MIKHSSRERGKVSNNILHNNLAKDILTNGLWSEPDLRFLVLDRGMIEGFVDDFSCVDHNLKFDLKENRFEEIVNYHNAIRDFLKPRFKYSHEETDN
jgi:hypothetical protein